MLTDYWECSKSATGLCPSRTYHVVGDFGIVRFGLRAWSFKRYRREKKEKQQWKRGLAYLTWFPVLYFSFLARLPTNLVPLIEKRATLTNFPESKTRS